MTKVAEVRAGPIAYAAYREALGEVAREKFKQGDARLWLKLLGERAGKDMLDYSRRKFK
jgi:hypothetical protein